MARSAGRSAIGVVTSSRSAQSRDTPVARSGLFGLMVISSVRRTVTKYRVNRPGRSSSHRRIRCTEKSLLRVQSGT